MEKEGERKKRKDNAFYTFFFSPIIATNTYTHTHTYAPIFIRFLTNIFVFDILDKRFLCQFYYSYFKFRQHRDKSKIFYINNNKTISFLSSWVPLSFLPLLIIIIIHPNNSNNNKQPFTINANKQIQHQQLKHVQVSLVPLDSEGKKYVDKKEQVITFILFSLISLSSI